MKKLIICVALAAFSINSYAMPPLSNIHSGEQPLDTHKANNNIVPIIIVGAVILTAVGLAIRLDKSENIDGQVKIAQF